MDSFAHHDCGVFSRPVGVGVWPVRQPPSDVNQAVYEDESTIRGEWIVETVSGEKGATQVLSKPCFAGRLMDGTAMQSWPGPCIKI